MDRNPRRYCRKVAATLLELLLQAREIGGLWKSSLGLERRERQRRRAGEGQDARGVDAAQTCVLSAEEWNHSRQPVGFCSPLRKRAGAHQMLDSADAGARLRLRRSPGLERAVRVRLELR